MTVAAPGLLTSVERLAERAADGSSRRLISATVEVDPIDPSAAVFASRRADDRWFCWEQPDRGGFALAALGTAAEIVSRGEDRFRDLSDGCATLIAGRLCDEPPGLPAGAGPVWVGGAAFDADGCRAPQWSSFEPALMVMPELAISRHEDLHRLTLAAVVHPGDDPVAVRTRLEARLASLRDLELPALDPHPTARVEVSNARPPAAFEHAVAEAVERIKAGTIRKLVLAREVLATAPAAHDPAAVYAALRELFPSCFCFCFGTREGAFVGASPELLIRRNGAGAATVALAGSARRSADPAVDDHLGEKLRQSAKDREEHEIVARRISRALEPLSVWVEAAPEPSLVRVANIQHLATPIRAQLSQPLSTLALAGRLHPTPAVGAEPFDAKAAAAIRELEGMDRGWYAGPVGWMDAAEDGEFCVALRSAVLRDRVAHLYAGAGIVADSDPAAELAETEIKLEAMLPLLT